MKSELVVTVTTILFYFILLCIQYLFFYYFYLFIFLVFSCLVRETATGRMEQFCHRWMQMYCWQKYMFLSPPEDVYVQTECTCCVSAWLFFFLDRHYSIVQCLHCSTTSCCLYRMCEVCVIWLMPYNPSCLTDSCLFRPLSLFYKSAIYECVFAPVCTSCLCRFMSLHLLHQYID